MVTKSKKNPPDLIHRMGGIELEIKPNGSKMEISISKIKKTIAIRKNRIENGIRDVFFGSKPHSNGDAFSRSKIVFFEKSEEIMIKRVLIIVAIEKDTNNSLIA